MYVLYVQQHTNIVDAICLGGWRQINLASQPSLHHFNDPCLSHRSPHTYTSTRRWTNTPPSSALQWDFAVLRVEYSQLDK